MYAVAYLTLEQQLESLGQRWGCVCQLVEQQGAGLDKTIAMWTTFDQLHSRFCDWLSRAEMNLSQMEVVDSSAEMSVITDQVFQLKVTTTILLVVLRDSY